MPTARHAPTIRPLPEQGGKPDTDGFDLLRGLGAFLLGTGQRGFGLTLLRQAIDACIHPLPGETQQFLRALQISTPTEAAVQNQLQSP